MKPGSWPSRRLLDLLEVDVPIVQAPMAGAHDGELTAAVCAAGGLGSLPCAMLSAQAVRDEVAHIRGATGRGFAMNFFCHRRAAADPERERKWGERLADFYREMDAELPVPGAVTRNPFDEAFCAWSRRCVRRSSASISACRPTTCSNASDVRERGS